MPGSPFDGLFLAAAAPFVGSFAGVLAHRLPQALPLAWDRSRCDSCKRILTPAELLPVLGWCLKRGVCGSCRQPIPLHYPLVELAALALALWALAATAGTLAWVSCLLGWTLLTLSVIDARHFWLPDRLTLPLLLAGLGVTAWLMPAALPGALLGAVCGYAGFAAVGWLHLRLRGKPGLGLGDAKLLAAAGAWVGAAALPSVVVWAALGGLLFAALAALLGRRSLDAPLPFGPFLALGFWVTWLHGPLEVAL